MGGGVTIEGVTSALLYTTVIIGGGALLWRHKPLRLFIVFLWLFNFADIVPQVLVSGQNGYVPEFWVVNYLIACAVFAYEYRRRKFDLIQLASVCYGLMALLAGVCILARYVDIGLLKADQALASIHILHWVMGLYLAFEAFLDIYRRFASNE